MIGSRGVRATGALMRKELRSYAAGATIYIAAVVFLLLWQYLFFREAFLIGEASLRGLFGILPWMLLILVPALTMGSLAQERSEGTLELLLTHPLRDRELVVGKFLAALAITALLLLSVIPIAASFASYADLDWGMVLGQYLAGLLLSALLIALGIFVSTLLASQMSALLVTVAAAFLLFSAGSGAITSRLPSWLASFFTQLAALTHYESMARGVIDLRDVWYFLSAIVALLAGSLLLLLRRRYGGRKSLYRRFQVGLLLFVGIALLSNVVSSRIPGRIDLTDGNRYSLSSATRETISELDDLVKVTVYVSGELPAQVQPTRRVVEDLLRDYQTLGGGDLVVTTKDTSKREVAQEARERGIQELQFNVVGNEEFKTKKGFFGMVVSYGGKTETIPSIQQPGELEYQLTSIIRQLGNDDPKKIGVLSGHGEAQLSTQLTALQRELERQFEVEEVALDGESPRVPKDVTALLVVGPTEQLSKGQLAALRRFIDGGGPTMLLVDPVSIDPQTFAASANEHSLADLLARYGVETEPELVYDLGANVNATFAGPAGNQLILPYPFWIRTTMAGQHPATRSLRSVVVPWASSLDTDDEVLDRRRIAAEDLLRTSSDAGVQQGNFSIDPSQQFPRQDLSTRTLGIALSSPDRGKRRGIRMIAVGDSQLVQDDFVRQSPENLAFAMQSIAWLAQEPSLASIKVRDEVAPRLEIEDEADTSWIKYGNMAFVALLPALIGLVRLVRRRRLARMSWSTRHGRGRIGGAA